MKISYGFLWQCLRSALLIIFIFILIKVGIFTKDQPLIVTVNLRSITHAYIQQLSLQQLDQSKTKELAKKFSIALQNVLQQYSVQHHVLLLPQEAVIEGAPDATLTICKNTNLIKACDE